jgi:dynactin-2
MEEVGNIKESVKADQKAEVTSAPITIQQVQQLQKQLTELRLEQVLGSESIADLSDPHGALQKKLISQLEVFKQVSESPAAKPSSGKGKPATTAVSSGDQIVYELYYKPEMAKFQQSKQAAEIQRRLEKLEAVVGNDPESLSVLSSSTSQRGLLESVSLLTSKLTLLDSTQLDQVEGRLQALSVRLNQISEKKQGLEEADKHSKVSELYELLKKTDALCASLPQVADRLVILKELHEQALQFTKALTQLDTTQQQITATLADNQKALKDMQGGFSKNMDVIKGNIAGIDSRLKTLKK